MRPALLIALAVIFFLTALPSIAAKSGTLTLLTVSEGTERGGLASVTLDVKPGTGRIFIDSLPHTRIDTQISIRFAQEFACSYLNVDCDRYDFFFTIRADSTIVGGPSAGVPLTVLTVSLLGDMPLRNDTVATGTINAGGLVGPVSGIRQKAEAAGRAGYARVLVPPYEIPNPLANESNETRPGQPDLTGIFNATQIDVITVATIEDALFYFTGKNLTHEDVNITVMPTYSSRMRLLAFDLCNRSLVINTSLGNVSSVSLNLSDSRHRLGVEAMERGDYYSAASYCFSANLLLREVQLENASQERLLDLMAGVSSKIVKFDEKVREYDLATLSDLETYMVVRERLQEASQVLAGINISNVSSARVAYAIERYNSAVSWSHLFGMPGTRLPLDKQYLREACLKKISETEERYNYVNLYVEGFLGDVQKTLAEATADYQHERYAECLFSAAKAKAEANMILSGITIPKGQVGAYIDAKLKASRRLIVKEEGKGMFPILGYSYYEYAQNLKGTDALSGLTFSEYSLEMSNLDMYFPARGKGARIFVWDGVENFLSGALFGGAVALLIVILVVRWRMRRQEKGGSGARGRNRKGYRRSRLIRTRRRARPSPNR